MRGQHHAQAVLYRRENPVSLVQENGWAPEPVWTGAENLGPTGIRSPNRPARSQSLYRLRYPVLKVSLGFSQIHLYRMIQVERSVFSGMTVRNRSSYKYVRAMISPIFRSTRLFTACGIMHPYCCRPVTWKRRKSSASSLPAGSIVVALYHKAVNTV